MHSWQPGDSRPPAQSAPEEKGQSERLRARGTFLSRIGSAFSGPGPHLGWRLSDIPGHPHVNRGPAGRPGVDAPHTGVRAGTDAALEVQKFKSPGELDQA